VRAGDIAQAPHVNVCLLSRGLLRQLYTRIYFSDDRGLSSDPVLGLVPADRRQTLLAQPVAGAPASWELIVRLQGEGETVFFDL
jgi:protocatechuate 3,4-dioxygenase alpha subunit